MKLSELAFGDYFEFKDGEYRKVKVTTRGGVVKQTCVEDINGDIEEWKDVDLDEPLHFDDLDVGDLFNIKGCDTVYRKVMLNGGFHTSNYGQLEIETDIVYLPTESEVEVV